MFYRKRFRMAIVVILTLLLTVALAPVAAAQDVGIEGGPPPASTGDNGDDTGGTTPLPGNGGTPLPGNGNGGTPLPGNGNGNGNGGTPLPGNGNGNGNGGTPLPGNGNGNGGTPLPGNGNGNGNMMMGPPLSWPPPNAIVYHAATPIQISALGGGLHFYFIGPDGAAQSGAVTGSLSTLAEMYPSGSAVSLYSGSNPGSGKPVTIEYLPADMKIRVSTYYADKPPHDFDKAYIFTVDADHSVTHERW